MGFLKGFFATAALIFSASSFGHGYYYTDYYDKSMHPPADRGFYLGLDLGYTADNWDDFESLSDIPGFVNTISTDPQNLGYRAFIGYMFNKTWALELGYTMFDKVDILITDPMMDPLVDDRIETNLIDLFVRIGIPLNTNFSVFTKLGVAYMRTHDAPLFEEMAVVLDKRDNVAVAFGAGILYRLSKHWSTDFSWVHYRGNDKVGNDFQPDIDFFSLSLALIFPT